MARIDVYEGNTITITCTVTGIDSLGGYTANLCAKEFKHSTDSYFNVTGSISGLVITFSITAAQNEIAFGSYYYEVTIDDGTNFFSIAQGLSVIFSYAQKITCKYVCRAHHHKYFICYEDKCFAHTGNL